VQITAINIYDSDVWTRQPAKLSKNESKNFSFKGYTQKYFDAVKMFKQRDSVHNHALLPGRPFWSTESSKAFYFTMKTNNIL